MIQTRFNIGQIDKLEDDNEYFKELSSIHRTKIANKLEARLRDLIHGRIESDYDNFISILHSLRIEHLIVGGFAVVYYGHHRPIGDLDIWVNPDKLCMLQALLVRCGLGVNDTLCINDHIQNENTVIQIYRPPKRVDLIINPTGFKFFDCYNRRSLVLLNNLTVDFIGLSDLIEMKTISGREKDKTDLKNLIL